ncbi:MAG: c-type cytochrome [Thiolinea sp.]
MKTIKYALPFTLLLTAGTTMAAELDGAKLYIDKTCASCHGEGGNKPIADNYPKLGGQSAKYMIDKLKGYKAGEITGNQAAVMTPMAAMLSDEEMEAVANYLAEVSCAPAEEKSE